MKDWRQWSSQGGVGVAGRVDGDPRPLQELQCGLQRVGGVGGRAAHHQVRRDAHLQ